MIENYFWDCHKLQWNIFAKVLHATSNLLCVAYPSELTIVLAGQQTEMNPGAGQASFVNQLEIARLKAVQNVAYIDGSYSI